MNRLIMAIGLVAACTGPVEDGTDAPTPVEIDGLRALVAVIDDGTRDPLQGVSVTSALETTNTDGDGLAFIHVERDAPYRIELEKEGYVPLSLQGTPGESGFGVLRTMTTYEDRQQVLDTLQVSLDDSKGVVTISVSTLISNQGQSAGLEDAVVRIDAPHALAFSYDGSAPAGIAVDSDITVNPLATVGFTDVEPGTTVASVTPPPGFTCQTHPGGEQTLTLTVEAGLSSTGSFLCSPD